MEYSIPKKSRQEINREYYEKHKEKHQKRYQQQKAQTQQPLDKYSQASAYKVLISLKEYTELNKEKQKL